ncbi:MAG: LPS assembly protein LptD [Syntrophobacterales bacterium]|jgi:LPS-assembly protein|nr:LPS assembly protein LptD [Syntrophobacterales bacterium]
MEQRCAGLFVQVCVLFFVLLTAPSLAFSAADYGLAFRDGPVDIHADQFRFEEEDETYYADGDVIVYYTGGYLKADSVILQQNTDTVYAAGRVFLKNNQDVLEGDRVVFNIKTKTGTVDEGRMFAAQNHVFVRGSQFEKSGEATYRVEDAVATTCDGPDPAWSIRGKELNVTIDGYGTIKHGAFYAGKVPLLYSPYFIFPVKTTRQTGLLLPDISYSKNKNGLDIMLPFYWAISEDTDATFYQHYMSKRGFREGVEFRYAFSPDITGVIYGDYLRDRLRIEERSGPFARDWDENHNRWSFYLQHESSFESGYYIRADIARVSDRWYFKDFSSRNYYRQHYDKGQMNPFNKVSFEADASMRELDSKIRAVKDWSLFNLTTLARYTDDFSAASNAHTLQQYPEITLTAINQAIPYSPLRLEFVSSYNNYYRQEGQKGSLFDVNPTLMMPVSLGRYAQFTPRAEWHGSFWSSHGDKVPQVDSNGLRSGYVVGGILTSDIQRTYRVGGKSLDKIRHGIRLELDYTYGDNNTDVFNTPDYASSFARQNGITYALINTLMTKWVNEKTGPEYREMMRLKVSQTYRLDPDRYTLSSINTNNSHLGPVEMEWDFRPLPYVTVRNRSIYDIDSRNWLRSNSDLVLTTSRGDSASIGYHYTKGLIEEVNLALRARLTRAFDVEAVLKRNELSSRTVEQTYAVNYYHQCWGIKLGYSETADDHRFFVSLNLYGLGFGL